MRIVPTALPEIVVVEPDVYRDPRGFFLETYHASKYKEGGIDAVFVQDNHSRSSGGTVRGLHAQWHHPQGKLVRVLQGEIFDVAVDIRRGSPSFLRWVGVELSAENFRQIYVPPGFAHGFCVVGESAEVEYKCHRLLRPRRRAAHPVERPARSASPGRCAIPSSRRKTPPPSRWRR